MEKFCDTIIATIYYIGTLIPSVLCVKYLGLTHDKRLTWAQHIRSEKIKLESMTAPSKNSH